MASSLAKNTYQLLRSALVHSLKELEVFRRKRNDAIKEYVGINYSDNGTDVDVPVNLLEELVNIYQRALVGGAPQVSVVTKFDALKPEAATVQLMTNQRADEIDLETDLRMAVLDAMFSVGIVNVGLHPVGSADVDGELRTHTESHADRVDLDDWVHDVTARTWGEVRFMGHRFRIDKDEFEKSKLWKGPDKERNVIQDNSNQYDQDGNEKVEQISRTGTAQEDALDYAELWDIYLPRENKIITMSYDFEGAPLREVDWTGPVGGPYHFLTFNDVPNNVMPLSPVALLRDLHDLANNLFRKLTRQAERQKDVNYASGSSVDDAQRVVNADDGETIRVQSVDTISTAKFGGVDPNNLAFFMQTKSIFNEMGGNLAVLAGLAPQAETLGQEQILNTNASRRLEDMQERTIKWTQGIMRDLAWYEWTNPLLKRNLQKKVKGTDISIPVLFTPDDRIGQYIDYNFIIEPFSLQMKTPGERLRVVMAAVQSLILPLAPFIQQQGGTIDVQGILELFARYTGMTELSEIVEFGNPIQPEPGAVPEPRQAANTTRTNVRVNKPGATAQGRDEAIMSSLLSNAGSPGSQPSQQAAAFRNVG